jgi:hypothetical protein
MTAAPPTSELAAFLTRMLDADEAAAREALTVGKPWTVDGRSVMAQRQDYQWEVAHVDYTPQATHIARHDPARVLAQVAALRAVVARYEYLAEHGDFGDGHWVLRHLAAIWASDDTYDPRWRI